MLSWMRLGEKPEDTLLAVFNFTPVPRHNYQVGVPRGGFWRELLNTDSAEYGGSGLGNMGGVESAPVSIHGRPHLLNITAPPLGALLFKPGKSGR